MFIDGAIREKASASVYGGGWGTHSTLNGEEVDSLFAKY
jgi:hypothetical protein